MPDSDHDVATSPDVATSLVVNYEWRRIVGAAIVAQFEKIERRLDDAARDDFSLLAAALIDDLYDQ